MNAHTPGPWKLDVYRARNGDPCARVLSADGGTSIADCFFVVESYEKANAALVAAAPDLLERLKLSTAWIRRNAYPLGGSYRCEESCVCIACLNDQAIGKAAVPARPATSQPSGPGAGGPHGL